MSDAGIQKPIGGVPVWIWGAGVGAAIILYTYIKRASSGVSAVSGVDSTPLDSSLNDFTASGSGLTSAASTTTPTTQSQWLSNALTYLEQQGYDPLTALTDLQDYLNGGTIVEGSDQAKAVSAALANQGTPPDLSTSSALVPATAPDGSEAAARAASPAIAELYSVYQSALASGNGQAASTAGANYLGAVNGYDAGLTVASSSNVAQHT